jgi:hypothetical protein
MSLIDKDGKEGNPHINLKSIIDLSHSNMKRRKLSLKKILETLELTAHSTMVESELDIWEIQKYYSGISKKFNLFDEDIEKLRKKLLVLNILVKELLGDLEEVHHGSIDTVYNLLKTKDPQGNLEKEIYDSFENKDDIL